MPNEKPKDLNELLSAHGVSGIAAVDAAPAPASKAPDPAPAADGYLGAFQGGDGRWLHSYVIDGRKVILPKKVEEMRDEDFLALSSSMYDPVSNRIPQNLTVKFREAHLAGYWANRKAQDGKSVRRLMAMGFRTAKKEDCDWIPQGLNTDDGEITDGDVVLMVVHKAKLFMGFLASYYEDAMLKGGQKGYRQTAEAELHGKGGDKVSHFMTPQANEFHGLGPLGRPLAQ